MAAELVLSLAAGVALSAACGLRVFLPILAAALAHRAGWAPLSEGFAWLGTDPAIWTLAAATVLEIAAYWIPWLDNALDAAAGPAAVAAGTLLTAAYVAELPPLARWTLALVAGGGAAGAVQTLTTAVRAASTVATGGLANPIFSTAESAMAGVLAALALFLPILALFLAVGAAISVVRWRKRTAASSS